MNPFTSLCDRLPAENEPVEIKFLNGSRVKGRYAKGRWFIDGEEIMLDPQFEHYKPEEIVAWRAL